MSKLAKYTITVPNIILLLLILTLYVNVACAPAAGQIGSVGIWADQYFSDIYIDGAYSGQTGSEWMWYDLSVGTHRVKISQSGYDDWTSSIYVSADQDQYVEAYLVKKTEQTGSVAIWSDQTYSEIYVDGEYFGQTGKDWIWYDIPVGTHKIKISQSGYDDWTDTIYVSSDEVAYVDASLTQYDRGRYSEDIYPDNSSDDGAAIILLVFLLFILYMFRGILKARKRKKARKREAAKAKVEEKAEAERKLSEQVVVPQPEIEMQTEDIQSSGQNDKLITSSAFGYKGATIKFKVKIENPTSEPISDIKVHLYVPDVFLSDDSEKSISMLEPGEGKTVTFEIRPTGECGDCNVSGRVNYYDYTTKKRQETDLETKSLSVVCPLLKIKEIALAEWRSTISHFVKTEETTREISIPAETLFSMASRVIEDMNMFMLEPDISSTPQMYNGVARFYGVGVKDLKYAAQIEVVGGTKKSKLILKAWAEREEALIGFYHGILDEIEKRVQVKGLIETDMVQNIYQYGDRIGTQVKDSFVYKSKVEADEAKNCPQCGKEKGEGQKFCSGCGTKF